jgi:hypothetical protein
MFLVGKGIPDHITSLPKRVLDTPFGQMLRPQLDASMRSVTQAPVPPHNIPSVGAPAPAAGSQMTGATDSASFSTHPQLGHMKLVLYEKVPPLEKLMAKLGTAQPEFEALKSFLQKRQQGDRHEAPLLT